MAAGSPAPRKRAPAKKTAAAAKRAPAKKPVQPTEPAGPAPAGPPPARVDDGLSVNQWLHELQATPMRIEVFDRWWELKLPTGARAAAWDELIETKGIRDALASLMFDQSASPTRAVTGLDGQAMVLESIPGSAQADEFLRLANEWVIPEAAKEFWERIERAIFGPGEASAS